MTEPQLRDHGIVEIPVLREKPIRYSPLLVSTIAKLSCALVTTSRCLGAEPRFGAVLCIMVRPIMFFTAVLEPDVVSLDANCPQLW